MGWMREAYECRDPPHRTASSMAANTNKTGLGVHVGHWLADWSL